MAWARESDADQRRHDTALSQTTSKGAETARILGVDDWASRISAPEADFGLRKERSRRLSVNKLWVLQMRFGVQGKIEGRNTATLRADEDSVKFPGEDLIDQRGEQVLRQVVDNDRNHHSGMVRQRQ